MTTFLNLDLDGKIKSKFFIKHLLFSFLWITAILILGFRIDIAFNIYRHSSSEWIGEIIPIAILALTVIVILTQKWYYTLALVLYPFLAIAWFIPKTILHKGKFYLFLNYINYIYDHLKSFKKTIIHFFIFSTSLLLVLISQQKWTKELAILIMSYFYISFIIRYVSKALKPAQLFGQNVENLMSEWLIKSKQNQSILLTTFVIKATEGEDLSHENKQKGLTRLLLMHYAFETINHRLNSFKGKRAYYLAFIYELISFLTVSIIFFAFINFQIFKCSPSNFIISGNPSIFEFTYYAFKKVLVFGDIDSIKPLSIISKTYEIFSFLIMAILVLVVILTFLFSLRNEKINENVKLTTYLFEDQNRIVKEYMLKQYETDIETALKEVKNIKKSLGQLKNVIDRIF